MKDINAKYTNRNVGGVIIATDGLYNKGGNPVYQGFDFNAPLYTIALGDTTVRKDVLIASVDYNRTVYLGNTFPLEVTVDARQCNGSPLQLTVKQDSATLFARTLTAAGNRYRQKVPVLLDARKKGVMRLKISIAPVVGEVSTINNEREIFIDVKEAKEKILLLANAPHPDLGCFKDLLESSQNYEVKIALAGDADIKQGDYNLILLHNLPSASQPIDKLFQSIRSLSLPVLFVLGSQTDVNLLNKLDAGLLISTSNPGKTNQITAAFNNGFSLFTLEDVVREQLPKFPPLVSPYGEFKTSGAPSVLLYQQVGAVKTGEPLLYFTQDDRMRTGFICGEGWWRWKLSEFAATGNNNVSRELLLKSVQYLSVKDKRSKFIIRMKNSFNENEPVLADAELFNDNYELINTPDITFEVRDKSGNKFPFVFSKTDRAYNLNAGFLPPGTYNYIAVANNGDKKNSVAGNFNVAELRAEQAETVADHRLLSTWSSNNGGENYYLNQVDDLVQRLKNDDKVKAVSYSEVKLQDLINLKWFFFLLLFFITAEWLLRKRAGSY